MATSPPDDGDAERLWAEVRTTSEDGGSVGTVRGTHEVEFGEPPWVPFGTDHAPSAGDYLLLATGGCQVEVLKQCLEKARVETYEIALHVERERDESGTAPEPYPEHTAYRFPAIEMTLRVETTPEYEDRVARCLDVCEDACIVSRSVERGIDITVSTDLAVTE